MIFRHRIRFLQQKNTTMMSRFDVVDLCHRNDERHRERTRLNRREIAHFPIITINLNTNHSILQSFTLQPTFTSGFIRWKW